MQLNTIKPAAGAKRPRRRVGRGIGSGLGKTAGRGHKGQKSRSGGFHKVGFEGGQMPLQRRLPKRGFNSLARGLTAEVRLSDLHKMQIEAIDLKALKAAGVVPEATEAVKVILSGKLERKVSLSGLRVTKGARTAIEAADRVIAVSEGMRADVLRAYPSVDPARVSVIHNGIDTTEYAPDHATTKPMPARRATICQPMPWGPNAT